MTSYVQNAINLFFSYLNTHYNSNIQAILKKEIQNCINEEICFNSFSLDTISYDELQSNLSNINEKTIIQKTQGVYYTDSDVTKYIIDNSVSLLLNDEISNYDKNSDFLYKTVFDPTCGTGEFLLYCLEQKILHFHEISVQTILKTIFGNDINPDSIIITKLRFLALLLKYSDITSLENVSEILNSQFTCNDFINYKDFSTKYDLIIGNPPYVETSKSEITPNENYGNIYANVISNSSKLLKNNGVLGFIIPISFISTPRMSKIRNELSQEFSKQYISSFADRPDCLFTSVHQKLNILLAKKGNHQKELFTTNYIYWYKQERTELFSNITYVKNNSLTDRFIPKLGNEIETSIFQKILTQKKSLSKELSFTNVPIWLNMRATFWVKVFTKEHIGGDYKKFYCKNNDSAKFCFLLLSSSLFWWFWTVISDCWHITNKELDFFKIPDFFNKNVILSLANSFEMQLEQTKKYVGTKQVDYEYKHKICIDEIFSIDEYVCRLYNLTKEETEYIKNYAYQYRMSLGSNHLSALKTNVFCVIFFHFYLILFYYLHSKKKKY